MEAPETSRHITPSALTHSVSVVLLVPKLVGLAEIVTA
jgi:hypothetical protein